MNISLESALLIIMLVALFVGAIAREFIRQQQAKAIKDGAVIETVKSMQAAMKALCDSLCEHNHLGKEQHSVLLFEIHKLSALTLDVERRLTAQEEDTRDVVRDLHRHGGSRQNFTFKDKTNAQFGEGDNNQS